MRRFYPFILLAGLALAAPASAQTPVTGTVYDAAASARLADVVVVDSSGNTTALTDESGRFTLPCTGATTLTFEKYGYESTRRAVSACGATVKIYLDPRAEILAPVNVVAFADRPLVEQPQAVTTLVPRELNRGTGLFLREAINLTPGVRMQARTMGGGHTITIRGYGTGDDSQNFIGSGYKAYYNGIPITDAEGQTILDDVDFAGLGHVEIIRGPASSIYGGGIGGVVQLSTALPHELGTHVSQDAMGGSHGLIRSTTRLANVKEGATTLVSYGHQAYDSYRIHSASRKDFGTFLGEFRPSDVQSVSTFIGYANSREERAGQLDSIQFAQRLNTGEDRYINNDAGQDIESFRAGVTHRYQFSDNLETGATAFYTGNTREDIYAVGLNSSSNQTFGARMVLNTKAALGGVPLLGVSGGEFEETNSLGQGYRLSDGVLGTLRSDLSTSTMQYSLFTEWDAKLPADLTLTAGLSANFIEYSIIDRMASPSNPEHLDGSGRKTFDPVITPRVALLKMLGPDASVYAGVSQGYSPPTASDAVVAYTGEPNEALSPERATQYQVGSKGRLLGGRLTYQVALFDLRVTDKLTSEAVFDGDGTVLYSYTVNAGDQDDRGIELAASYALIDDPSRLVSMVRPFASYTYSDFVYDDFRSDNNDDANTVDFSGNQVVGVAPHVFSAGVDAGLRSGVYMNATYHHTDEMPLSYDNEHWAPAYSLLNAKIGFARAIGESLHLNAFVGGHNLQGSLYFTQAFLNHKFDRPNPHVFVPGPYDATFYGGLNLSYQP
ncbi:MAG TPA: TonB-dependent receptor [Longimicrobiaceae bacterium]|nr:TonB-dependent receptor [Longimicrobiaceae bacterium]